MSGEGLCSSLRLSANAASFSFFSSASGSVSDSGNVSSAFAISLRNAACPSPAVVG